MKAWGRGVSTLGPGKLQGSRFQEETMGNSTLKSSPGFSENTEFLTPLSPCSDRQRSSTRERGQQHILDSGYTVRLEDKWFKEQSHY